MDPGTMQKRRSITSPQLSLSMASSSKQEGPGKILHFVRHAHATHNEAFDKLQNKSCYLDPRYLDADLSALGEAQCRAAAAVARPGRRRGGWKGGGDVELVVVSPLRRTLRTAALLFPDLLGEGGCQVPWVALEGLRERNGRHPCDRRRPISQAKQEFPLVDFSQILDDEDVSWGDGEWRESDEEMAVRSQAVLAFLGSRPERNIVVVTHKVFLFQMFNNVVDCAGAPALREWFDNLECRSARLSAFPAAPLPRPAPVHTLEEEGGEEGRGGKAGAAAPRFAAVADALLPPMMVPPRGGDGDREGSFGGEGGDGDGLLDEGAHLHGSGGGGGTMVSVGGDTTPGPMS